MNLLAINSTKNCCEISNNRFSKLKVKKQLLLILTFLFLGTFNLFSQTTGSCTPAANPAFSTECDMCVIVILDESGSTSNISTQIKNAMISFAGALNDPCLDVNMAIVEYGSRARIANIGGTAGFRYVNTDFVNDLTPYFDGGGTSASTYNSSGGTNWDHGLQVAKTLADSPSAPCDNPYIVMFSDGNPTYAGSLNQIGNGFSTSTDVLEAACNSANALKNNGSRIFTVALPNPNLVTSNVQAIENGSSSLEYVSSNPGVGQTTNIRLADYLSTNSSNVGTAFTALAAGIAQPTISTTSVSGPIDGFCPEIIAPTFTVNHDCQGDPTPTVNTSGPTNNGCEFSQTWEASYAHTGVCPAVAENVSITYTWFQDTTAPTINCPTEVIDLGEDPNPQTLPTEASVEAYIETLSNDNCEILSTVATAGTISNLDCVNTQEFTVVVTDKCGLIDECTLTYTWRTDCCVPAATCNNLIDVPLESCVATIPSSYDAGNTDAEIADVFSGVVTCGIAGIRHEDSNAGDICNGTTITRTYYLTDDGVDVPGVICTRDFVFTAPSLTINCPTNVVLPSCSTEQVIIDAYNLWVSEITVSGGCNTISNIADIPALPSYDCDAGVLLNFTLEASDDCGTVSCETRFLVDVPETLIVSCPQDVVLPACSTEQEILVAYNNWVGEFLAEGDCNLTSNIADIPALPAYDCEALVYIDFTFEASNDCDTASCNSRFIVDNEETLQVVCPQDVNLPACSTEQEILTAYNNWVGDFLAEGDCNMTSNIADIPALPIYDCDAGVNLQFTLTAVNACGTASCSSSFVVQDELDLEVNCPTGVSLDSSSTEQEIQDAYDAWKLGFTMNGGCNATDNLDAFPSLPDFNCGTAVDLNFTYTATDRCHPNGVSCSSTFLVPGVIGLTVDCPTDVSLASCASEADILSAYNTWISGFGVNDGDNPVSNIGDIPALPAYECGVAVDLSFTLRATDACHPNGVSCMSTFKVEAAPPLELSSKPDDVTTSACVNPADEFASWISALESMSASGGCNALVEYSLDLNTLSVDGYCNTSAQVISVDINAKDDCGETNPVTATFTVPAYSNDLSLLGSCPTDNEVEGCSTNAEISLAFDLWKSAVLSNFSATGGCNAEVEYSTDVSALQAPIQCGSVDQVISVDVKAIDDCGETSVTTCSFTVKAFESTLEVTDVEDEIYDSCDYASQGELDLVFQAFLDKFGFTGGCDASGQLASAYSAPDLCAGGTVNVTYNVTDLCENGSDTASFTITPSSALEVSCPTGVSLDSSSTEEEIQDAYDAWKLGFTMNGGCN
ncbi:vWA domain-containing protein, partial [Psychroserpens sp. S379A]|uniref:vWA domain-containing protein n=1 Tax=Psychroserpens sp. S379A TaxID=3415137 RepID=UPI003C798C8C